MGNCLSDSFSKVVPLPFDSQLLPPTETRNPNSTIHSLTVLWDMENLAVPRQSVKFSAGDLAEAILRLAYEISCRVSGCVGECPRKTLVCVHPSRFPVPLMNSLRTRGVTMLDAGPKRGAVDTYLKGYMNDEVVDTLLQGGGPGAKGMGERWIFVASGDSDFAMDARRARRAGFRVGIIYGVSSSVDFTKQADAAIPWAAILALVNATHKEVNSKSDYEAIQVEQRFVQQDVSLSSNAPSLPVPGGEGTVFAPLAKPQPSDDPPPAPESLSEERGSEVGGSSAQYNNSIGYSPIAVSVPTPSKERAPCRDFNSARGCHRLRCRFPHVTWR